MRSGIKISSLIARVFLISSLLSGCVLSKPTKEDILGVWTEQPTGRGKPSFCASLEFFDDGRFEAKSIPREYFVPALYPSPPRIDAKGSWELDTSSKDPFAVHRIRLVFDASPGFPSGWGKVLYIAVGGGLLMAGVDDPMLFEKDLDCK
jgi:hypothetical protein